MVCGMISVRSIVCPFQNAVPSIVVLTPFASLVSAGFLFASLTSRYLAVAPEPWMYHCHGSIWFDQLPVVARVSPGTQH